MPKTKLTTCPHCGGDLAGQLDGRAGWWLFRVRLYDMQVSDAEPIADSDANLPPDKPGETVVRGLWKVLNEAAIAAADFHSGATLRGWGQDVQERKLRGIRSTLQRSGGRGTFRISYDTLESFNPAPDHVPRYLARVDVLKTEGVKDAA